MPEPTAPWSPPLPAAPGFEHLVVETPGLRWHVAVIGDGDGDGGGGGGDPVVLLHGFPQHWWQWHAVAPLLAASGHRVICPDLRGAGWTTAEGPRIERRTRLLDMVALLDAMGIDRAHVVSHDMGAITAMQLSYEHPDRVRTAVTLSVPPGFMTFSPRIASGFRHLPRFIWHRPGASLHSLFSEAYVARPMTEATAAAHLAPMSRPDIDAAVRTLTRRMILPEAAHLSAGTYRRQRLRVPTLFVFGRCDHPWTEENLRRICARPERHADRVELAFVDDAAHFITDDAPGAVADLALDWFERAG